MECILCLDVQEFKSDIQMGGIDCCLEECLNICNKYLNIEVSDFGLAVQKGHNFYYSYPFCFTCFLSVAKLVKLHNKLISYSKTFSECLLTRRNRNEIHDLTSTDDSHSVIEEIKSEIEDDDLEDLVDNNLFSPLKIDTNSSKPLTRTKIVSTASFRKNLASVTDKLKPKKIRIQVKKLKLATDNLYPTRTKIQKCSVRRELCRMRNSKPSEFLNNDIEREMRKAIVKEHKKFENASENKVKKDFMKEKPSKSKKRNNTMKKLVENNPPKMFEKNEDVEDKVFPCDICGKVIISGKGSFDDHRRLHTGEKPFKCDESDCLMTFRTLLNFSVHKAYNHTADYPHACKYDNCDKKFKLKSQLWSHHETYHKTADKLHICEHCGQSFKFKGRLGIHLRKHNAEDRFYCTQCSRSFTTNSQLNVHVQLVHTREISFVCEVCGKSLTSKLRLQDHSRTHSGEKYKCQHCGKLYASRTSLNLHRRNANH